MEAGVLTCSSSVSTCWRSGDDVNTRGSLRGDGMASCNYHSFQQRAPLPEQKLHNVALKTGVRHLCVAHLPLDAVTEVSDVALGVYVYFLCAGVGSYFQFVFFVFIIQFSLVQPKQVEHSCVCEESPQYLHLI